MMVTPDKPLLLISDDDPSVARAFARQARRAGMLVVCDLSSQVLHLAKQYKPSVILLDINQTVDGLDLLDALKADPDTAGIRVILTSAVPTKMSAVHDHETRAHYGKTEFVVKPLEGDFWTRMAKAAGAVPARPLS